MEEDFNSKFPQYFNASKSTQSKALILRKNTIEAEKKLWNYLKDRHCCGAKFRRQHPFDFFIADFYCHQAKLVIEIDGAYHSLEQQKEFDNGRTAEIEKYGINVIRFTNEEVKNNIENVLALIKNQSAHTHFSIDIANRQKGIYILKMEYQNQSYFKKLIIQ